MQQPLAPNVWDVQQTSWSNNDMPPRECAREDSSVSNPRRCSQFTFRHLSQMASCIPSSPLRVVAHIDLDCFYAQVEMVRLGIAEDTPFAVQQWQGLIAVNYPARSYGIGRHCTITEAKKLCPKLITQHVATWREADGKWAYREDPQVATDKVCLDPYRSESRKILVLIKELLPHGLQRVEKASIDEVFLDLSAHVHAILLERFPELLSPQPHRDLSELLPLPPISDLDWQADTLVDAGDSDNKTLAILDPDWDDVAFYVASGIVRHLRSSIKEKLGYTCSAGIARNKLLSKLGSSYKKPNQQTVIRNRAVAHFLSGVKFTKIRNLGGKLGEQVSRAFNTDSIPDLLTVPIEQMKVKLGDETAIWLYNTLRGVDMSEVNPRIQIKSMLSAKSFRPTLTTIDQAVRWLRIFAADIFSRLVEEGVLEHRRHPKTINLHYRPLGGQARSRSCPIPQGRALDDGTLFDLAKTLLTHIVQDGNVWPCAGLSLSVGSFEDSVSGNMGIDAFLLKGQQAEPPSHRLRAQSVEDVKDNSFSKTKRRRLDVQDIRHFFTKKVTAPSPTSQGHHHEEDTRKQPFILQKAMGSPLIIGDTETAPSKEAPHHPINSSGKFMDALSCSRCSAFLDSPEALQCHQDWHLAKDIQDQERVTPAFVKKTTPFPANVGSGSRKLPAASKRSGRSKRMERGQQKLSFG